MASLRSIRRKLGKYPCRKCINEHYLVHLVPDDLRYFNYQEKCTSCGKAGNIVAEVTMGGRMKLLGKRFH